MDAINSGMLHLYYRKLFAKLCGFFPVLTYARIESLLQYSATLAFYLYLRASDQYVQHPELLRSHPITSRLLALKQSIATLEDLGVGESDLEDDSDFGSDAEEDDMALFRRLRGIGEDELQALLADMNQIRGAMDNVTEEGEHKEERTKKPKKKADLAAEEPPKKKRKTENKTKAAVPIFDLEEPEFPTKAKSSSRPSTSTDADAFGELTTLQTADAMDKAARKRSLRFHTSKIESASARRERARANAGGDDDIPWRNRQKEKEEKQRKAAQKSRELAGDDLDDAEPEPRPESNKKRTRDEAESGSDDDGTEYYDLVKRKSKEKKEKKKVEYETAQAEAK